MQVWSCACCKHGAQGTAKVFSHFKVHLMDTDGRAKDYFKALLLRCVLFSAFLKNSSSDVQGEGSFFQRVTMR